MYQVSISASTGVFDAKFESKPDIEAMVSMVAAGAQVRDSWNITIYDSYTKANVAACGPCTTNMRQAVGCLLEALNQMPKRPRSVHFDYDVTVPVHIAMNGAHNIVDAEDFVRKAINDALNTHQDEVGALGEDLVFMYNGDTVQIGSAKAD